MRPEQHFDQVKANQEQLAIDISSARTVPTGPYVKLCGSVGPYAVRRPLPKQPQRLEVLSCTRPDSHGGPFHQAATPEGTVIAQWDRSGNPLYPSIIKEGKASGSDIRV